MASLQKKSVNFFTLDLKTEKEGKKFIKDKSPNDQNRMFENEWVQENKLICLSHKYENWNLKVAQNT